MNILITGAAGFLGTLLTQALLKRGQLRDQAITSLTLTDLYAPARREIASHPLVTVDVGDLLTRIDALCEKNYDAVFHFASAVSGECEADFDLGLRSNLDTTRKLLDALRAQQARSGQAPLLFLQVLWRYLVRTQQLLWPMSCVMRHYRLLSQAMAFINSFASN
jgi:D-erythronate 2-dehydrogenase